MDDFVDRVVAREAAKEPVRRAVRQHWPAISRAMAAGASLTNIYKELTKSGHFVGRGVSIFTSAVRHIVKSQGLQEGGAGVAPETSMRDAATPPSGSPPPSRQTLGDDRYEADF